MASSSAILTDAFPANQRGMALGRQHGGRRRRLVPRPADRRLPLRVALEGDLLGRRADRHPRHHLEHPVAEGTRRPHAGPARLGGHPDLRRRPDGAAHRHHLRHPALRRLDDRVDQPVGARVDRLRPAVRWWRSASSNCASSRPDGRHPAVPLRVVRHGQPRRADVLDGPRRPAVHADHLAAGHLASVARLQLRVDAAVGGHLHAAR